MGTVALNAFGATSPEVVLSAYSSDAAFHGRARRFSVVGSSSYATGGDSIPMTTLGLRNVNQILVEPHNNVLANLQPGFSIGLAGTPSVPLLRFFETLGTEVANAVNLSTRSIVVIFIGD